MAFPQIKSIIYSRGFNILMWYMIKLSVASVFSVYYLFINLFIVYFGLAT